MSDGGVHFEFFEEPSDEKAIPQIVGDPHTMLWLWALLKVLVCAILWIFFGAQWMREWSWSRSPDLRNALEILRESRHFPNKKTQ